MKTLIASIVAPIVAALIPQIRGLALDLVDACVLYLKRKAGHLLDVPSTVPASKVEAYKVAVAKMVEGAVEAVEIAVPDAMGEGKKALVLAALARMGVPSSLAAEVEPMLEAAVKRMKQDIK